MDQAEREANAMLARVGSVGAVNIRPYRVGATTVRPQYVGAPVQQVAAFDERPVQYSQAAYVDGNLTFFGLGRTVIPAGTSLTLPKLTPSRPISPQKMLCPSTVTGLLLSSISIGGTNLLAGDGGVPIELFSEVATTPPIDWITIDPAVGIVFTIGNPTGSDLIFTGALYGTAVRQ